MISGLAFDRNRRPPTALLLADGLQTIAAQLEASASGAWSTISTIGGSMAPRTASPVMPPPLPPESTIVTSPGSQPSTPSPQTAASTAPRSSSSSRSSAIRRVPRRSPRIQGRPVQGSRQPGPAPAIPARLAPDSANQPDSPTSELQSFAGHYSEHADPYAMSMIGDSSADEEPSGGAARTTRCSGSARSPCSPSRCS